MPQQDFDVVGVGFIALGCADVEGMASALASVAHLGVSDRDDRYTYLTGDATHDWIRLGLSDGEGMRFGIGLVLEDGADVETIAGRADRFGVGLHEVATGEEPHLRGAWRFTDPDGVEVTLYRSMVTQEKVAADRLTPDRLLHGLWAVPDMRATARFYCEVLGMRVSDELRDQSLYLRGGNHFHHSVGIGQARGDVARPPQLGHLCFHYADFDRLMSRRAWLLASDVPTDGDVRKHAASGSISVYVDKSAVGGLRVEFTTNHEVVDEAARTPRVLVPSPQTRNMWAPPAEAP